MATISARVAIVHSSLPPPLQNSLNGCFWILSFWEHTIIVRWDSPRYTRIDKCACFAKAFLHGAHRVISFTNESYLLCFWQGSQPFISIPVQFWNSREVFREEGKQVSCQVWPDFEKVAFLGSACQPACCASLLRESDEERLFSVSVFI